MHVFGLINVRLLRLFNAMGSKSVRVEYHPSNLICERAGCCIARLMEWMGGQNFPLVYTGRMPTVTANDGIYSEASQQSDAAWKGARSMYGSC